MATQAIATLNEEQSGALQAIKIFLEGKEQFFVLRGSAGTGKTFCIRKLIDMTKGRFVFTAPTNKATKVLRESVTSQDYKPECRTIYSLLGLRLEANGEVKELKAPEDPLDLSSFKAVIVDEGSMVNQVLFTHIKSTAERDRIKFIFLGDPAQLPPVKEIASPIWSLGNVATLEKVMRHDNAILELATQLRSIVDKPFASPKLAPKNDGEQGIWQYKGIDFERQVKIDAECGAFSRPNASKVIAWRNVEVDRFNSFIRGIIYPQASQPWLVGDRVLFTAPAKDLDDEPMASTDDEGEITRADEDWHPLYGEFKTYRLAITLDDNRTVVAQVLHPDSQAAYQRRVEELSTAARSDSRKWRQFWEFKDAFHQLRYAYAITAHRAQGSTYDTAFVYWQDILQNRNRQEAYRCLYVAVTRPKRALILS